MNRLSNSIFILNIRGSPTVYLPNLMVRNQLLRTPPSLAPNVSPPPPPPGVRGSPQSSAL